MRSSLSSISLVLGLSGALVACSDDDTDPVVRPDGPSTITVTSGVAADFVAFRDGYQGDWKVATKKSATSFEAVVNGPYALTVVCQVDGAWQMWQTVRTPGAKPEENALTPPCTPAAALHAVTGTFAQAGTVAVGTQSTVVSPAGSAFSLQLTDGKYDLVGLTDTKVVILRDVTVAGPTAIAAPLDTAAGATLVDQKVTNASKPGKTEVVTLQVDLATKTTASRAKIFSGPITGPVEANNTATVKLVPAAVLTADDVQTVTLIGTNTDMLNGAPTGVERIRAVRRVVKPGTDISFDMPTGFGSASWTLDQGRVSVNGAPAIGFSNLVVQTTGTAMDGKPLTETLEVDAEYEVETGLSRLILDTAIDGFKTDWKLNVNAGYRSKLTQSVVNKDNGDLQIAATTQVVEPKPPALR